MFIIPKGKSYPLWGWESFTVKCEFFSKSESKKCSPFPFKKSTCFWVHYSTGNCVTWTQLPGRTTRATFFKLVHAKCNSPQLSPITDPMRCPKGTWFLSWDFPAIPRWIFFKGKTIRLSVLIRFCSGAMPKTKKHHEFSPANYHLRIIFLFGHFTDFLLYTPNMTSWEITIYGRRFIFTCLPFPTFPTSHSFVCKSHQGAKASEAIERQIRGTETSHTVMLATPLLLQHRPGFLPAFLW